VGAGDINGDGRPDAVVAGRTLLRFVSLGTIRRIGAGVCLLLAALATYDLIRSLA